MIRYSTRALLVLALTFLSGCGIGPAITALGYTADGLSYLGSGKGVADHAISAATAEDCAMFRLVQGGAVCRGGPGEYREKASALAMISDGAPQPAVVAKESPPGLSTVFGARTADWPISPATDIWATPDGETTAGLPAAGGLIVATPAPVRAPAGAAEGAAVAVAPAAAAPYGI